MFLQFHKGDSSMDETHENPEARYGSFLIRIRQENADGLKGEIEHVQSGEKRTFTSLIDIQRFIEVHLESLNVEQ